MTRALGTGAPQPGGGVVALPSGAARAALVRVAGAGRRAAGGAVVEVDAVGHAA